MTKKNKDDKFNTSSEDFDVTNVIQKMFQPDRDKLLRRLDTNNESAHLGPSYSSILNVERKTSRIANVHVMVTVYEDDEENVPPNITDKIGEVEEGVPSSDGVLNSYIQSGGKLTEA